jgi:thiamine biosynthesis lipoprotein
MDFRAMGCHMLALADADDERTTEMLARVPAWFEEWEESLSRFRDSSELNALNRAEGRAVAVSETLWHVLQHALQAAQASQGLVTPTVLDALVAAGYDRPFDSLAPSQPQAIAPTRIADWRNIELDATKRMVRLPRGARLDFGGTAKGWAAGEAARRLAEFSPALVDAGGDIAVTGARANGDKWVIGVADPFTPEQNLALLMIERGAVATSGRDYRRWVRDGKPQHHIIDPRTGAPAATDVLSATVIASSAVAAEVAAKAALILGSRAGLKWIEDQSDLAGMLVLEDGTLAPSSRFGEFVWSEETTA